MLIASKIANAPKMVVTQNNLFCNAVLLIDAESSIDCLPSVVLIKKFTLLSNEWTDSSGELTPSLKLKRHVVAERYENEIEAMYEEAK